MVSMKTDSVLIHSDAEPQVHSTQIFLSFSTKTFCGLSTLSTTFLHDSNIMSCRPILCKASPHARNNRFRQSTPPSCRSRMSTEESQCWTTPVSSRGRMGSWHYFWWWTMRGSRCPHRDFQYRAASHQWSIGQIVQFEQPSNIRVRMMTTNLAYLRGVIVYHHTMKTIKLLYLVPWMRAKTLQLLT